MRKVAYPQNYCILLVFELVIMSSLARCGRQCCYPGRFSRSYVGNGVVELTIHIPAFLSGRYKVRWFYYSLITALVS
jgi:hypothetical protein